jgi:hypothetical protein
MDRITLVVNSCKTYSKIALPVFLEHANKYNPGFSIVVIIGGCPTPNPPSVIGHYTIVETRNNSLDYTGLIGLIEEDIKIKPLFFYIHDTTVLGPKFFSALEAYSVLPEGKTSMSFQFPSSNIGIYSTSLLKKYEAEILALRNTDESTDRLNYLKDVFILDEDKFFRLNIENNAFFPTKSIPDWGTTSEFYKNGNQRLKEYFPDLDFTKLKASWARKLDCKYMMSP